MPLLRLIAIARGYRISRKSAHEERTYTVVELKHMHIRDVAVIVAAAVAGLLGSVMSRTTLDQSVFATSDAVIKARRFEVVDATNRARLFVECDTKGNAVFRLLYSDYTPAVSVSAGAPGTSSLVIAGADGGQRVKVHLGSNDKPVLEMGDAGYRQKLILGSMSPHFPDSNIDTWALAFEKSPPASPFAGFYVNLKEGGPTSGAHVFGRDSGGRRWDLPPTAPSARR